MTSSSRLSCARVSPVDGSLSGAEQRRRARNAPVLLRTEMVVDGDATVVRIAGELDLATAPDLTALLDSAALRPGIGTLILDLGDVEFVDAAGVAALLQARARCADHQITLRLRGVHARVRRVLALTATGQYLGLCG